MTTTTMQEIFRAAISSRLLDTHTAIPAVVVSYDADSQTCTARPVVRGPVPMGRDGWEQVEMPEIQNVPVGWPRGGGWSLQFPLSPGDHVLLVFAEADVSGWRQTGQTADAADLARHDLSWPWALPVAAPDQDPLRSVTAGHVEVPSGQALTVGEDASGTDFVALASLVLGELDTLKSAISSHSHTVSTTGTAAAQTGSTTGTAFSYSPSSVASNSLKARKP